MLKCMSLNLDSMLTSADKLFFLLVEYISALIFN